MQPFQQNALDDNELEGSRTSSDFGLPLQEPAAESADEYVAELPTWQLIGEVRRLMAAECRAERLVCRYLADLADRVRQRSDAMLIAYSDEFDAIRRCFGLGLREARERLRVGRALRQLPRLERAFVAGELAYSRIREVTRVATPQNELEWLQRAQHLNMRELERLVAQPLESNPGGPIQPPDEAPRTTNPSVRVTFELSADAWTLVQRALQQVRTIAGMDLTDGEALAILARGGLARAASADLESFTSEPEPAHHSGVWGSEPPAARVDSPEEGPTARSTGTMDESTGPLGDPEATQGGSPAPGIPYHTGEVPLSAREQQLVAIGALPEDPAARSLLRLMGDRHGWTTDELIEASGWSYNDVCCALVQLEIGHWVRRDFFSSVIVKTQRSRPAR